MNAPLLPPQSIESEQAVLGALLIPNSLGDDLAGVLIADDFYRADHRLIYALITQLITAQQPADFITLCDSARRLGKLEDCGGQSYIGSLVSDLGSSYIVNSH